MNQKKKTRNQNAGFTLLEVMVAVAILAVALTAIYKLHAGTISMTADSRFYTVAPLLAQSKMAEFELKDLEDLNSESGDFGEDFPAYEWSVTVEDVESEPLESVAERLKRIDLTIIYDENMKYGFRTYKFFDKKKK